MTKLPIADEYGRISSEEKVSFRLHVEIEKNMPKEVTPESVTKKARCKLVHDNFPSAHEDAIILSEAGGTAEVTIVKVKSRVVEINQSSWSNGSQVTRFGKAYTPTTRKERKEQEDKS